MADLALELMGGAEVRASAGDRHALCRAASRFRKSAQRWDARSAASLTPPFLLAGFDRSRPAFLRVPHLLSGLWDSITNRCGVFLASAR
jgi:hypothetical protein